LELSTTLLPGSTSGHHIPPWWSVESKSFDASTMARPLRPMDRTACRMKLE
jgi:hypothetical protein